MYILPQFLKTTEVATHTFGKEGLNYAILVLDNQLYKKQWNWIPQTIHKNRFHMDQNIYKMHFSFRTK